MPVTNTDIKVLTNVCTEYKNISDSSFRLNNTANYPYCYYEHSLLRQKNVSLDLYV